VLYHRALFTCPRGTHALDSLPLPCSILLLAGGRGQRMGSGQRLAGVAWSALIEHLQRLVRPLTDELLISCNRNHDATRPTPTIW
jgi:molybdopterin-guanine dinucleotide biosynthesis protein A